jgi:hypothetical protein
MLMPHKFTEATSKTCKFHAVHDFSHLLLSSVACIFWSWQVQLCAHSLSIRHKTATADTTKHKTYPYQAPRRLHNVRNSQTDMCAECRVAEFKKPLDLHKLWFIFKSIIVDCRSFFGIKLNGGNWKRKRVHWIVVSMAQVKSGEVEQDTRFYYFKNYSW